METKRLLIVEDHPDIRKLIHMTLKFGQFELHEAADAQQGLAMVHAVAPDLLILDVMMAGLMDGYQLCKLIKSSPALAHIGVILVTARGRAADIAVGAANGADAYLVKPFSPIELINQVNVCLARLAKASPARSGA